MGGHIMIKSNELMIIIKSLIDSKKSFENILPDLLITFGRELNSDWVAYWKIDQQNEIFQLEKVWTNPLLNLSGLRVESRNSNLHYGLGFVSKALKFKKPVYSEDIGQDMTLPRSMKAFSAGLRSGICFPVINNDKVYGIFETLMKTTGNPTLHLLEVLETTGLEIGRLIKADDATNPF
jgi:hypothetical protein